MPRLMLTDEHWSKLRAILLEDRVYDKPEHRNTMEGILYRMRVSCPWRDLPESFGLWNTIFRRFLLWSRKGILQRLFKKLITEPDFEWIFIDGSIVKAHQHSAGANSKEDEAILIAFLNEIRPINKIIDMRKNNQQTTIHQGYVSTN